MARLMPKPPFMSKEDSEKWDKRESLHWKVMLWLFSIAVFLFLVLCGIILYYKFFNISKR